MSRDVVFDKSASWYLPSTPTPNSNPRFEDEVSEVEMPLHEHEIGVLEESPISFRLSGLNERLSRHDHLDKGQGCTSESEVGVGREGHEIGDPEAMPIYSPEELRCRDVFDT